MGSSADSLDPEAVEGELSAESTEPQAAPARRSTPVVVPVKPRQERSRRSTLVSPIPALMAASMRAPADRVETVPPPTEAVPQSTATGQTTSRLAEPAQAALLGEGEPEYVVEIGTTK